MVWGPVAETTTLGSWLPGSSHALGVRGWLIPSPLRCMQQAARVVDSKGAEVIRYVPLASTAVPAHLVPHPSGEATCGATSRVCCTPWRRRTPGEPWMARTEAGRPAPKGAKLRPAWLLG